MPAPRVQPVTLARECIAVCNCCDAFFSLSLMQRTSLDTLPAVPLCASSSRDAQPGRQSPRDSPQNQAHTARVTLESNCVSVNCRSPALILTEPVAPADMSRMWTPASYVCSHREVRFVEAMSVDSSLVLCITPARYGEWCLAACTMCHTRPGGTHAADIAATPAVQLTNACEHLT